MLYSTLYSEGLFCLDAAGCLGLQRGLPWCFRGQHYYSGRRTAASHRGKSLTIFTSDGWVWCRVDPLGRGVLRKPAQQRTSIQPRRSYCPRALHCGSLGVSAAVPLISRYMGPAARYDDFEAVVGCPGFWLLIAQIL